METLERIVLLQRMLSEAGGTIVGRKKLHKLAYICQYAGTDLGQTFTFYLYGVFSPSLAEDLTTAESWSLIHENETSGDGYVVRLGKEIPRSPDNVSEFNTKGFDYVREMASQTPSVLEVLTTILYLRDEGYSDDKLERKVRELKGHLSSSFNTAYNLAEQYFQVKRTSPN